MITIFEPVSSLDQRLNEQDVIRFSEVPQPGTTVAIGGERRWLVLATETYSRHDQTVCVAFIAPEGVEIPDQDRWTATSMKGSYPAISRDVQLWQSSILSHGFGMDGSAPTGRLYNYTQSRDSDRAERIPRPWAIDIIATYKPIGKASYSAVHLCHCLAASLPEMAVA